MLQKGAPVNRIAGAGQHHLGGAQPHSRVVHVIGHRLGGTLDVNQAMIQVSLYIWWIAHSRSLAAVAELVTKTGSTRREPGLAEGA